LAAGDFAGVEHFGKHLLRGGAADGFGFNKPTSSRIASV
jgi:hypothetical protein